MRTMIEVLRKVSKVKDNFRVSFDANSKRKNMAIFFDLKNSNEFKKKGIRVGGKKDVCGAGGT